jgi:hypothetical protein
MTRPAASRRWTASNTVAIVNFVASSLTPMCLNVVAHAIPHAPAHGLPHPVEIGDQLSFAVSLDSAIVMATERSRVERAGAGRTRASLEGAARRRECWPHPGSDLHVRCCRRLSAQAPVEDRGPRSRISARSSAVAVRCSWFQVHMLQPRWVKPICSS